LIKNFAVCCLRVFEERVIWKKIAIGCWLIVIEEMDSFFDFALIQLESFLIFADKEPQLKFRLMLKKVFLRVDLDSGLLN
jgi:hypothetical protein